jgi:hypothetical protein
MCPWFLNDAKDSHRDAGLDWDWAWQPGVPHWFFLDHGLTSGMRHALKRCEKLGLPIRTLYLNNYSSGCFSASQVGEWPDGTSGFVLGQRLQFS